MLFSFTADVAWAGSLEVHAADLGIFLRCRLSCATSSESTAPYGQLMTITSAIRLGKLEFLLFAFMSLYFEVSLRYDFTWHLAYTFDSSLVLKSLLAYGPSAFVLGSVFMPV